MMDWGKPELVLAIIAFSTLAWLINNWIRAKHGYALEDEWGGKTERGDSAEAKQLRAENTELRELLGKVEQRMQVLERIVTDKGYSLADEIEALRDRSLVTGRSVTPSDTRNDSGIPLDSRQTEQAR